MGNSGNTSQRCAFFIIACGVVLRLHAASLNDLIHPDEHFQTLEPAFRAVYGFGWRSWEWYHGFRPWSVPGVFMPLLWLLKILGVGPGMALITCCRGLVAICSALPLWGFHRLCVMRGLPELASLTALGLMAFLPNMVSWGASTFSESIVFILLWGALPFIVMAKKRLFLVGMLASTPLAFRYQMGAWFLALTPFFFRLGSAPFLRLLVGAAIPLGAVGLLDYFTFGTLFHSLVLQIRMNGLEGLSDINGTSPWYAYGGMLLQGFGAPALAVLLLPPLIALLRNKLRWAPMDRQVLLPALFFCLAHMVIGHKEQRFLLPVLPALFYFCALGLNWKFMAWPAPPLWRLLPTLVVAGAFSAAHILTPQHFEASSLGALTGRAAQWFNEHPQAPPSVALVAHYWIWTRGEMGFGRPMDHEDIPLRKLSSKGMGKHSLAFTPAYATAAFNQRAHPWGWALLAQDSFGNGLFVNNGEHP